MFKTVKLPIKVSQEDKLFIQDLQRQSTSVVRYAYNRFFENLTEKDIRLLSKSLKSIDSLNSWLTQCAILDAKSVFDRFNLNKDKSINSKQIFFGGKSLLSQYHKRQISKEQFKQGRLRAIDIQGEKQYLGNRMFELQIQSDNSLIFKVNRNRHIKIELPNLRNNWLNQLYKLEYLAEQKQIAYSIKLTSEFIYISFEDKETQEIPLKSNRCLGIDLNPNCIGVSVLEFDSKNQFKILCKKTFDISKLTVKSGKASESKETRYLHNKLRHETIQIADSVLKIAKSFNCKFVFLEDLHFKQSDFGLSKGFNRLTKNKWLKSLFQEQLKKRLEIFGIKCFSVNPAYSSIIGNLQSDSFDPVNASIEIARRGMEVIILKTKKFYPDVWIKDSQDELWKQTFEESPKNWKEIFARLKNSGLKYRVSLDDVCQRTKYKVFSLDSKKSKVRYYCFT